MTRPLVIVGLFLSATAAFAQYTLELTGGGDGVKVGNVPVGPYQGTISSGGKQIFSGYMICDDYTSTSKVDDPWSATATNAGSLNGKEKFSSAAYHNSTIGTTTTQQDYDMVAWLANQLVQNATNATDQVNLSFAIWDIFDGASTNPDGGTMTDITNAFKAVKGGYVGTNVTVYTPNPFSASQEFLVVNGPAIQTAEPSAAGLLGVDLAVVLVVILLVGRRWMRA